MTGLNFSLHFALLGMAIVFSILLLFTMTITLFSHLLRDKKLKRGGETALERDGKTSEDSPGKEQVAAAAVTFYVSRNKKRGAHSVPLFEGTDVESCAWPAASKCDR